MPLPRAQHIQFWGFILQVHSHKFTKMNVLNKGPWRALGSRKKHKDKTTNIKTHTHLPPTGNNLNVRQERTGSLHHGTPRQGNTTQPLRLGPHLLVDEDV